MASENQLVKSVDLLKDSLSLLDDINTNTTSVVKSQDTITDNSIVRGSGGQKNVQSSGVYIDDNNNVGINGPSATDAKLYITSGSGANGDCILRLSADTDNTVEASKPIIEFLGDGGIKQAGLFLDDNEFAIASSVGDGGISLRTGSTNGYTNATERMRITTGGNVGIGTNNPGHLLEVYKDDNTTVDIIQSRLHATAVGGVGNESFSTIKLDRGNYGGAIRAGLLQGTGPVLNFGTISAGTFTERMRLDESGNLAIGRTSTTYKLDVNGSLLTNEVNIFGSTYGLATKPNTLRLFGLNASGGITFDVNSKNDALYIKSNGNVGVGTTTPYFRLDLGTAAADKLFALYQNAGASFYGFGASSGNVKIWGADNCIGNFNYNGRLGVGSTSVPTPGIHLAVGDADTGLNQQGDGILGVRCNNLENMRIRKRDTQSIVEIRSINGGLTTGAWPTGWGGGLHTNDINCQSIRVHGGITYNSDDRLKFNEELIPDATSTLMKIKPQVYEKQTVLDAKFTTLLEEYNTKKAEYQAILDNPNSTEEEILQANLGMGALHEPTNPSHKECGVISQQIYYEVPELRYIIEMGGINPLPLPEAFNSDPNVDPDYDALGWGEDPVSVKYENFIGYLIKGFQEQQTIIENLKTRIETLENS